MKTCDVCKRDVVIAKRDTPLTEAARLMRARHVGCVVVVDAPSPAKPIGLGHLRGVEGRGDHLHDDVAVGERQRRSPASTLCVEEAIGNRRRMSERGEA